MRTTTRSLSAFCTAISAMRGICAGESIDTW